jgi:hypothetical protein
LLQAGINGAKRLHGEKDMLKLDDAQNLLQDHFDYIGGIVEVIENESEAMEKYQEMQKDLMTAINTAVKGAVGFRGFKKASGGKKRVDA